MLFICSVAELGGQGHTENKQAPGPVTQHDVQRIVAKRKNGNCDPNRKQQYEKENAANYPLMSIRLIVASPTGVSLSCTLS